MLSPARRRPPFQLLSGSSWAAVPFVPKAASLLASLWLQPPLPVCKLGLPCPAASSTYPQGSQHPVGARGMWLEEMHMSHLP